MAIASDTSNALQNDMLVLIQAYPDDQSTQHPGARCLGMEAMILGTLEARYISPVERAAFGTRAPGERRDDRGGRDRLGSASWRSLQVNLGPQKTT